jgi:hypothetical protein
VTAATWSPADAGSALRAVRSLRRDQRRARRRRIPWSDRVYPYYSALWGVAYLGLFLAGTGDVRIDGRRLAQTAAGAAAIRSLGSLVLLAVVGVIGLVSAGAVHGGPVAIPVEDLRVLLPTPVRRSVLLRRALLRSYRTALLAGLAAAGALVLLEVALLSQPLSGCAEVALALPVVTALGGVSLGWLLESHPHARPLARAVAGLALAVVVGTALDVSASTGRGGQLAAWARLQSLTRSSGLEPLARALRPGAAHGPATAVVVVAVVLAATLSAAAWARTAVVSAERISRRSGRARALRAALILGLTSSAYVTRTAEVRRSRRRRWTPSRPRSAGGAALAKAVLQEQGSALLTRTVLSVAVLGVLEAALLSQQPLRTHTPAVAGGALAGLALAALATRYADPLRVDVELTTPVASLPVPYSTIAGADLLIPGLCAAAAGIVSAVLVPALGLVAWSSCAGLALLGVLLAPAIASIGALSATANSPSPFLSPGTAIAYRLRGVIAALVVMTLVGLLLHPLMHHPGATVSRTRPDAFLVLIIADGLLVAFAVSSGAKALLRAR